MPASAVGGARLSVQVGVFWQVQREQCGIHRPGTSLKLHHFSTSTALQRPSSPRRSDENL